MLEFMSGKVPVLGYFAMTVSGLIASLSPIMFLLQFIAAVASAILGVYGVIKIFKKR